MLRTPSPLVVEIQHWPVSHNCDARPSCDSSPVRQHLLHHNASIVSYHLIVLALCLCNVPVP
ncbi:hypothetical protein V8C42DRAFT_305308 [Trichoderma barbatum]